MTCTIRMASEADGAAIAGIYAPFCESSVVSFEIVAPDATEMTRRITAITSQYPWLVLDDGGVVAGYVYGSRHAERAAYGWAVDVTAYIGPAYRRCGAGRALYTTLFELLRRQGYFKAYAGITLPNDASAGLHEAMGFVPVGVYRGVGYKKGAWHDVAWYQRPLQAERDNPDRPVPVSAIAVSPEWTEAVSNGLSHYRIERQG